MSADGGDEESKRPYRLWDANAKVQLRWRYYASPRNAHLGALIEARWGKPGTAIEVFDMRGWKLLGQYRRTPTSVAFTDVQKLTDDD
jgi:hypothetical protein